MFVVSANYLDENRDNRATRDSNRWLIRPVGEKPNKSMATNGVKATGGITFREASGFEHALGCVAVAVCANAEAYQGAVPDGLEELRFAGYSFRHAVSDHRIEECHELYITSDGRIYAQITAPKPATQKRGASKQAQAATGA